ncbi:MAG: DUF2147 domain-containing protein [Nitrosomonas sp.]|nr:DUF2147 domain-containing protein [Nitrosomonas sp.]MBK7364114.1 DUF2147 domain-containing protein [Nitrosomonas sp.]
MAERLYFREFIDCLVSVTVVMLLFSPTLSYASNQTDKENILGLWLTKKKDVVVQIQYCEGKTLCGYVTWISPEERSEKNATLCGKKVLWDARLADDQPIRWVNGILYKADEDKYYSANLQLIDVNTLALRAYVGVPLLGKTKKLTRTSEKTHPPCIILNKS